MPALKMAIEGYINDYHLCTRHFFIEESSGFLQGVMEKVDANLEIKELIPGECIESACESFISTYCDYKFDIKKPPLFKFGLLKISQNEYIFIFSFHHLVIDGFTGAFLTKNLSQLYNHFAYQTPKPEKPFRQFEDFLLNEKHFYSQNQQKMDILYWKNKLESKELSVNFDFKPRFERGNKSSYEYFELDEELTKALKKLSRENGVTVFIALVAFYVALLYRYLQTKDICISYVIDNRSKDYKDTPGYIINTLPLIITFEDESFKDLFQKVKMQRKEDKPHQKCNLFHIIEELKFLNAKKYDNEFNVGIGETYLGLEPLPFLNVEAKNMPYHKQEMVGDLFLAYELKEKITFQMEYKKSVFDKPFIQRMIKHFLILMRKGILDPELRIRSTNIISDLEIEEFKKWNKTENTFPEKNIPQIIDDYAEINPDSIAILSQSGSLNYRVLNEKANLLADDIRARINSKESANKVIAICMERSLELVIAILGVLKSGGSYLPIDINEASYRVEKIIDNIKPGLLITQNEHLKKIPVLNNCQNILNLNNYVPISLNTITRKDVTPDSLAYIIYTSGSTGIPKGVMIEHKSVVNVIEDLKVKLSITEQDRILNLTSFAFDIYGLELYLALFSGATHIITPSTVSKDPFKIFEYIQKYQPTVVVASPTIWRLLLRYLAGQEWNFKCVSIAEALPPALASELKMISKEVWDLYGPTETTIVSMYEKINDVNINCIGKPLANTKLYVLDQDKNLLPKGVVGELYIAGVGLARGYYNDLNLTQEKFIKDPFTPNSQLYKTGDLVRRLEDGKLEYLGRKDSLIKIRGQRVDIGEVESVLGGYPGIRQCVVTALKEKDETILVAYYILKKTPILQNIFNKKEIIDLRKLQDYLKKRLPSYMLPIAFREMDTFPFTTTGKIDRENLPKSFSFKKEENTNRTYDAIEYQLKEIWQKILKCETVDVNASFDAVGGHSLAAVYLSTEIKEFFGLQIPVAWIMEHDTIRLQAIEIKKLGLNSPYKPIIKFRSDASHTIPLFMVNPALAGAEVYEQLSKCLPEEVQLYGIDSYNLNSGKPYIATIESLATKYISYIKTIQPDGPYRIGGWSFGATVAYEIGQQLMQMGEEIIKLYLLDGHIFDRDFIDDVLNIVDEEGLVEAVPEGWKEYLTTLPKDYLERTLDCFRHDIRMLLRYKMKPFLGSALLVKTTHNVQLSRLFKKYLHNGWKPYIKMLEMKYIDSDHFSLMEGGAVNELARTLAHDIVKKIEA